MRLEDGTRDPFFRFIEPSHPSLLPGLTRLYGRKEAPPADRHEVQAMVRVLQERDGLRTRHGDGDANGTGATPADEPTQPRQAGFAW